MKNKAFNDLLQWAKRKGIKFLLGTPVPGQGIQAFSLISAGTPDAVVLADVYVNGYALSKMANTSYQVLTSGETVLDTHVDESSKTVDGFTILHAAALEVVHVVVIGTIDGMPDNIT